MKRISLQDAAPHIVAAVFALAMAMMPWEQLFFSLNGYYFADRTNYLAYFLYRENILSYSEFNSPIDLVSKEVLWHYALGLLISEFGISPDIVFGAISFLTIYIFARTTLLYARPWALILLINPLVVDFAFSQLRMALAVSILGAAFLLKDRKVVAVILSIVIAPLIHTGAAVLLAAYLIPKIVEKFLQRYSQRELLDFIILLLVGLLVAVVAGPLKEVLLTYMGDRRAAYENLASSFTYSIFWISLLLPLAYSYRRSVSLDCSRVAVVVLTVVAANVVFGGYSTRFLAATFPFIICSILTMPKQTAIPSFIAFLLYASLQWLYWLKILGG